MEYFISILHLLRTVEKVAISVRNGYAYIGFRRRGCSGCGDDKSVTAVFAAEYMILSGGEDFQLILRSILTDKRESLYCAHPYECAFVVFEK